MLAGLIDTHLFDQRVVVDFDVYVDGRVRKSLKDLSEEGNALIFSPLTEKLYTENHEVRKKSHIQS